MSSNGLRAQLTSKEPMTMGKSLITHAAVILAILTLGGSGLIAWAQTQSDLDHNTSRLGKVEHTLEVIRQSQSDSAATLRGLAVQSAALTRAQERIADAVERLDHRLDDQGNIRDYR